MSARPLASTIKVKLTGLQHECIDRIDNEDFSGVMETVRKDHARWGVFVSDDFLRAGILALKQYYAVALLDPMNEHAVSDSIDPFWHAHILDTPAYIPFCDRVFGQYVHHKPLDHSNAAELRHVARLYAYTTGIYRKMFSYVDEAFYPEVLSDAELVCTHMAIASTVLRQDTHFPRVDIAQVFATV